MNIAAQPSTNQTVPLYDAIFDAAALAIIATDSAGTIIAFNPAAERMLGYSADEMIGQVTPAVFHDADEIVHRAAVLSAELGRTIEPGFEVFVAKPRLGIADEREWTYIRKDGNHLPVSLSITALRDAQQNIIGFVGIAIDITMRKQLMEELSESEEKYRQIIEVTRDGIVRIDPRGIIVFANPRGIEMYGYTEAELLGKNIFDLVKPALREDALNRVRSRAQGVREEYELCFIRKDGSELWVINAASPILDRNGKHIGSVGVLTDITERKQHEQEREHLIRELNEVLLFKDQFLATMSHELRTPLNAILGYSGIALMQDDLPEQSIHMVERIKVNSERLLHLINDILDISRINAKRIEILSRPVSLDKLVQGWNDDFRQQVEKKGLAFEFSLDSALPDMILGDEERLTQIVANLLHNAIKFTEHGEIKLHIEKRDNTWLIQVIDTGIGIADTWQHLIFEEFRQVDSSSRRKHGGAGLGLSIVQKLCLLMGGTINVVSKLGEGSTFAVTLPLTIPLPVPQSH